MDRKSKTIYGWGRSKKARCVIVSPHSEDDLRLTLRDSPVIVRGAGLSFGDPSLTARGLVVSLSKYKGKLKSFNEATGLLNCWAGETQYSVLQLTCPKGWVLPSIPGASGITIGGMIAADAHGKNHYQNGSIGRHLLSMKIMLAGGEVVKCSRAEEPDLFWATLGGLGLTGIVIEVELQLCRINSVYASSTMIGFEGVDQLVDLIESRKSQYEYILGWADGSVRASDFWRGAVSLGRNMRADEVGQPWHLPDLKPYRLPFPNPVPTGRIIARVINNVIGRKFRDGIETVTDLYHFYFPQEIFANWNTAFGPGGFVDYQCCIPYPKVSDCLKQVQKILIESRIQCFLIIFKRFGSPEREGYFSFPMDGFSFTIEAPIQKNIYRVLDHLDEVIVGFGGRLNPIKDSRTSPEMLRRMYPNLDKWLGIKHRYDPQGKFCSEMSRRLELTS